MFGNAKVNLIEQIHKRTTIRIVHSPHWKWRFLTRGVNTTRQNYRIRAYLAFIQHERHQIVCSPEDKVLVEFTPEFASMALNYSNQHYSR